jgi:hypothetical protein
MFNPDLPSRSFSQTLNSKLPNADILSPKKEEKRNVILKTKFYNFVDFIRAKKLITTEPV